MKQIEVLATSGLNYSFESLYHTESWIMQLYAFENDIIIKKYFAVH